jgi:hypothetical protein
MLWIPTAPALALAAWALLMAALGRPPDRVQFIGTVVVTVAVVVFTIVKVSSGGGHWNALFIGYTLTALLLPAARVDRGEAGADQVRQHDRRIRRARRTGAGPADGTGMGRVLTFIYGIFALSATARATFQILTKFSEARLALPAVAGRGNHLHPGHHRLALGPRGARSRWSVSQSNWSACSRWARPVSLTRKHFRTPPLVALRPGLRLCAARPAHHRNDLPLA